jgi:CRP/FNR family transcriptional regulator, anaerobic regulatory protein
MTKNLTAEHCFQQLIRHMQKFIALTDSESSLLPPYLKVVNVGKKEHLMETWQPCKYHYFVVSGCLRMYFFNQKGDEQTIQFAIEDWWMTDHSAFNNGSESLFCIQAVEPSTVLALHCESQDLLFERFPGAERYFRLIYQRAFAAAQHRMKVHFDNSGEDTYLMFKKRYPAFADRVPQNMLASFLGISPEYLSVVKKRHA